jgi:cytochrome bd-type quinol oxidase subunit 2
VVSELRRSAKARAAAAGAAVVALVLLASLAGRHPAWSTGVGRRSLVSGAGHAFTVVLLVVALAFVVAYVRLARQRRQRLTRADLRVALALLLGILLALLLARGLHNGQSGGGPGHPLPAARPHGGGGSHGIHWSDAKWILVLPLLALLGLAAASFALARRRRAPAPRVDEPVAEAVVAVLDEALDDLGDERDPRRAVIAAYARMEDVLAEHGLERRPAETPYEYLARVLTDLRASERSARRLTELFEWAKFSTHEVSERMRADAVGCLTRLRAEVAS